MKRRKFFAGLAGFGWCAACAPLLPEGAEPETAPRGFTAGEAPTRLICLEGDASTPYVGALLRSGAPRPTTARESAQRNTIRGLSRRGDRDDDQAIQTVDSGVFDLAAPLSPATRPRENAPRSEWPWWAHSIGSGRQRVEVRYQAASRPHTPPQRIIQAAETAMKARETFFAYSFKPPASADGVLRIQAVGIHTRGVTNPEWDHIKIDDGLVGHDLDTTIAHEIFHRIQYAYNAFQTVYDWHSTPIGGFALGPMLREGGARLAEVVVTDPRSPQRPGRYAASAAAWMSGRGVSLVTSPTGASGSPQGAAYEAGLFWKYFAEQHGGRADQHGGRRGESPRGPVIALKHAREAETQRVLLEATAAPTGDDRSLPRIEHLRHARFKLAHGGPGHFDQFYYLDAEDKAPLLNETSWGNFLVALALNGTAGEDSRFQFEESREWRGQGAARRAIDPARRLTFEQLPKPDPDYPGNRVQPIIFEPEWLGPRLTDPMMRYMRSLAHGPAIRRNDPQTERLRAPMLTPYAMTPYSIAMPARLDTVLLTIGFEALDLGLEDALVQVIMLDRTGRLRDLHRIDCTRNPRWERSFACRDLSEVLILVSSRVKGGDYKLRLSGALAPRPSSGALGKPILFIAPANALPGRNLTEDPATTMWGWMSPDIDASDQRGFSVIVRNIGTAPARDVTVRAWRRLRNDRTNAWEPLVQVFQVTDDLISDDECRRRFNVFATDERNCGVLNGLTSGRAHYFGVGKKPLPSGRLTSENLEDFGNFDDYIVKIEARCSADPPDQWLTILSHLSPGGAPYIPYPWRNGTPDVVPSERRA